MSDTIDTLEVHGVGVSHHFGGGTYAKETHIPAGVMLQQHKHPHAHLSILAKGRAFVEVEGYGHEYVGPVCMNIMAGVAHSVTALTDVVWYCIHATDDTDPTTVDTSILTGAAHV